MVLLRCSFGSSLLMVEGLLSRVVREASSRYGVPDCSTLGAGCRTSFLNAVQVGSFLVEACGFLSVVMRDSSATSGTCSPQVEVGPPPEFGGVASLAAMCRVAFV